MERPRGMSVLDGNGKIRCRPLFLLAFLFFYAPLSFGQGSSELTIYDEGGVPFDLWMDGERKSKGGESTRVKVDSIKAGAHKLLIRYPDTSIPGLEKKIELKSFMSRTYALQVDQNGEGREWNLISEIQSQGKEDRPKKRTDSSVRAINSASSPLPRVDSAFIASYKGSSGCSDPMRSKRFKKILLKVKKAIFEKERISIAKKRIEDRCVLSSQVAALMRTFDYEENRLDLAKYAYGRTFDQKNYKKVRKALNFQRSRDELERYLQKLR
ncbi:MAG: DUF4476 domain-containing protein [Flavobacteriales bacterium]